MLHWISLFLFLCSFAQAQEASRNFKWKGDLRLRTQMENDDNKDSRVIERVRARFGVQAQLDPSLRAEIRLATGTSHRSANQNFGDKDSPGPARRAVGLDYGYAEWSALSFLKVDVGRFPQFHFRPGGSEILLDDDIALEGFGAEHRNEIGSGWSVFSNWASAWIRENYDSYYSVEQTDNMLNFGQAGVSYEAEDGGWGVTVGGGFYNFVGLQNMKFADIVVGGEPKGNSEFPPGTIKNNYVPRQAFIETHFDVGSWQTEVALEHIVNSETVDPNKAWWVSNSWKRQSWDFGLSWGQIASDAVPAMFTSSSFGNGQTDVRGVRAHVQWKFTRGMSVKLTQFANRLRYTTDHTQYMRTHLDLSAAF